MSDSKLSAHTTWLFAFGSVAAGIATSYALSGLGQKATAGVYFALVALGGFGATYLTRARVRGAVLAFLVAGVCAAGAYFTLVDHFVHSATTVLADAASAGAAHAQGDQAGAQMGQVMGVFVAALVFLETIVAGIGGAFAGSRARSQGGLVALAAAARASR